MIFRIFPLLLSFSLSMRSPNIAPNPMDYQIAFATQKADTAYAAVEIERENGINYFDKETWLVKRFGRISVKERYLEKESRNIKFNQIDCRYNHQNLSAGYGLKHIGEALTPTHNIVAGWRSKTINYDFIIAQLSARSSVDIAYNFNRLDVSTYNEAKFRLNAWENISLSMLFKYERLGEEYDYQLKTAINMELK